MRKSLFGIALAALAISAPQPLFAQNDVVDRQRGNVHFKTSCNDAPKRSGGGWRRGRDSNPR